MCIGVTSEVHMYSLDLYLAPSGTHSFSHYEYLPCAGWIAGCSRCGKLGKYRSPAEGRPFQHSTGIGSYCGYFRLNPRRGYTQGTRPNPLSPAPSAVSGGGGGMTAVDPATQYMYMVSNGILPSLLQSPSPSNGRVLNNPAFLRPGRPQLATVHSIGISGQGQRMEPMTVHDGMAEPVPEESPTVPARHPPDMCSGAPRKVNSASSPPPLSSGSHSSKDGMDFASLQQYANAVLGHTTVQQQQQQPRPQHSLSRTEMVPMASGQPTPRYAPVDSRIHFPNIMSGPVPASAAFDELTQDEPSSTALLTSALTALTAAPLQAHSRTPGMTALTSPSPTPPTTLSMPSSATANVRNSLWRETCYPLVPSPSATATRSPDGGRWTTDEGDTPSGRVGELLVTPCVGTTHSPAQSTSAPTVHTLRDEGEEENDV